jgi:hypothetical protein
LSRLLKRAIMKAGAPPSNQAQIITGILKEIMAVVAVPNL